ncbi:MAG TPA: aminotransferase class V-fold PLP-dependent enzyme [Candidatus Limnocylindrales bacterium]|nr:aminotransferase class V-fold PLP-dependent enzyme [Candidatus Limnocylindrales bacterium]
MIYLDNAATSWPKPEIVYRAMDSFARSCGANPGRASFRMAVKAEETVRQTRASVKNFFGAARDDHVIFTLNCTDALNIALKGLLKPGDHVITSHLEHNSVSRPLNRLKELGICYSRVSSSPEGLINPEEIKPLINAQTKLIVLSHASNVLGTVQPVQEIGRLAREHDLLFLLDVAQTAGEIPITMHEMGIDLMACPGHKGLFGPPGTGVLVFNGKIEINSLREGGTGSASEEPYQPKYYPDRLEAGTPNTHGIAGLKAGIEFIQQEGLLQIKNYTHKLLSSLLKGLSSIKGVTIYGSQDPCIRAGLVSFNIIGWEPQEAAAALDSRFAIACRAGLHCAPWTHKAIGTFPDGAIRFSLSYFNTEEEIASAISAVVNLAKNPAI